MGRKNNKQTLEALVSLAALLPWWVGTGLALVSYLALHSYASAPNVITPDAIKVSAFMQTSILKGLALVGQYVLPGIFLTGAVMSWFRGRRSDATSRKVQTLNPVKPNSLNQTPACPVCASAMVLRGAKRGSNAGNSFWGCSQFPRCKGSRNAD
jgi:hypothetical protein